MHTNIVVTKKGDTEDYFKNFAFYCEPDDLASIRFAVEQAYNTPFDDRLIIRIKENYKWENTAQQTLNGYSSIMRE